MASFIPSSYHNLEREFFKLAGDFLRARYELLHVSGWAYVGMQDNAWEMAAVLNDVAAQAGRSRTNRKEVS